MKFVLILTMWIGTDNADGGMEHVWALDTGMTGEDCIALMVEVTPAYDLVGGLLSCEIDRENFGTNRF